MTLSEWLSGEKGRATLLADHFKITLSAVSQWRDNGVPVRRMRDISSFTKGEVSISEMVVDRAA